MRTAWLLLLLVSAILTGCGMPHLNLKEKYPGAPATLKTCQLYYHETEEDAAKARKALGEASTRRAQGYPEGVDVGDVSAVDPVSVTNGLTAVDLATPEEAAYLGSVISEESAQLTPGEYISFSGEKTYHGVIQTGRSSEHGPLMLVSARIDRGWLKALLSAAGQPVYVRRSLVTHSRLAGFGYSTSGKEIDVEAIEQFKEHVTTQDQVRAALGLPVEQRVLADASEVWIYEYQKSGKNPIGLFLPLGDVLVKEKVYDTQIAELIFENGVLVSYGVETRGDE